MLKLSWSHQFLAFRHPFGISSGSRTHTPVTFTRIELDGVCGHGEASMPPYLGESHESVQRFLRKAIGVIASFNDVSQLEALLHAIDAIEEKNTAAKAAIDIALHDLAGKLQHKPWYRIWHLDKARTPHTTYTISIGDDALIGTKVKEAAAFSILKVKLGTDHDKRIIERIREFTQKPIAVDANQGWSDEHAALDMIHWLNEHNILFVEQPLSKTRSKETAWLTERSPLPVIADESVQRLDDVKMVKGIFSGINIKLMKCTGMYEAYSMIEAARELGLKILIGCMSESSCAVSAAAQLSPLADWADLDGPLLISEDHFSGITFEEGKICLNDEPGIGVRPLREIKWGQELL
jgi:L-alanine-DL-glutamate epimerase-like enolase superfamily enzyme